MSLLDSQDKEYIDKQLLTIIKNMSNFPKFQYSEFTGGKQGQVVIRTDDKEEFETLMVYVKGMKPQPASTKPVEGQEPLGVTDKCTECNGQRVERSGTSKQGKPWTAKFCQDDCGAKPIWL
jgi:hypothetical protein